MSDSNRAPEATMLRLSRYHCFVGELLRSSWTGRLRSRQMAEELGVVEETVRRDLSYVDIEGRPGAGYDPDALYDALETYLGLSAAYPFVAVCSAQMLGALASIFPAEDFGMQLVACFSTLEGDSGAVVGDIEVRPLSELACAAPALGASVALIACAPEAVNEALDAVHAAGISAALPGRNAGHLLPDPLLAQVARERCGAHTGGSALVLLGGRLLQGVAESVETEEGPRHRAAALRVRSGGAGR